jgi:hypothetical protein
MHLRPNYRAPRPDVNGLLIRAAILVLALWAVVLLWSAGCAPRPPIPNTPTAERAYTADQVVLRVNELQAVAIELEARKVLPTARARLIVQLTIDANMILREAPVGWQGLTAAAWDRGVARLPPDFPTGEDERLRLVWAAVRGLVDALRPAPAPGKE